MQPQVVVDLTGDSDDDGNNRKLQLGSGSATDSVSAGSKRKHRRLQMIKNFFHERGIASGHRSDNCRWSTSQLSALPQSPSAILCNPSTLLFNTTLSDRGWGCGYRNCQMLISSLMQEAPVSRMPTKAVPQVRQLQEMLELSWRDGYDRDGADQLDHRAMGTRKWIGTTEIYCILAHLGVRSHIVDFHCASAADGSHPALFSWVVEYFTSNKDGERFANRHPLYLQHQGHSRTVVGVDLSNDVCLLVFDPDVDVTPGREKLSRFRLPLARTRRSKQYQILYVEDDCFSQPIPKQISSQRIP
ncbi:hypothetical protein GGI18_001855 [Coemansia linderi]|uniref:Uncharacterized protein n=1 Tax=Coemansia linderi TaxID=2663919 RepID=A0ACC1KJ38_9FUNG|nr:hypothetical protein GGI18_001855 [Coemansia linderi]